MLVEREKQSSWGKWLEWNNLQTPYLRSTKLLHYVLRYTHFLPLVFPCDGKFVDYARTMQENVTATTRVCNLFEDIEDGEIIRIITLEDIFVELLQVITTSEVVTFHQSLYTNKIHLWCLFCFLFIKKCLPMF